MLRADELRIELGGTIQVREDNDRAAASPSSTEDVAAVLRLCSEKGLRVEIAGAGTKRGWGGAVESDLILEMKGLRGVREHSWQDLTATVGAGTPWAEMQQALAAHGQMVALDPLWQDRATVGGVLATNDSGAWRLRYGSARDLVIGMTLVLADGTVARTGGKVVKNVAGYDLHKLMVGAFGTLGVITEVTFRLHPVPSRTETFTYGSANAEAVGRVFMQVLGSQLGPHAVQFRASRESFLLDIELSGKLRMNSALPDALIAIRKDGVVLDKADPHVFAAREKLFAEEESSVLKVTMLPSAIAEASVVVAEFGGNSVSQGSGILFASVPAAVCARAVERLQPIAAGAGGGTVSLLQGNSGMSLPGANVFAVMREIKRRFDPERFLNRGAMGGV